MHEEIYQITVHYLDIFINQNENCKQARFIYYDNHLWAYRNKIILAQQTLLFVIIY